MLTRSPDISKGEGNDVGYIMEDQFRYIIFYKDGTRSYGYKHPDGSILYFKVKGNKVMDAHEAELVVKCAQIRHYYENK